MADARSRDDRTYQHQATAALLAEYAAAVDEDRPDDLAVLLTDDVVLVAPDGTSRHGTRAVLDHFTRSAPAYRSVLHHVSNVRVTESAPDGWSAQALYLATVVAADGSHRLSAGRYRLGVAGPPEGARLRHLEIVLDQVHRLDGVRA